MRGEIATHDLVFSLRNGSFIGGARLSVGAAQRCAPRILAKMDVGRETRAETAAPIAALLENHRAFLSYLERRLGDRELAEDILQDAFIKIIERPEQAPADEGIVPWFYRTLRNAAIGRFRRRGTAERAIEAFAREVETHQTPTPDMEAEICALRHALGRHAETGVRGSAPRDRRRGPVRQGVRPTTRAVRKQCRCARVQGTRGAQETGDGILRHLRGTRMHELHLPHALISYAV